MTSCSGKKVSYCIGMLYTVLCPVMVLCTYFMLSCLCAVLLSGDIMLLSVSHI